ncbi:hypothetical protein A2U01_0016303, partial [Trifolium medium]|nr:hypothetical protein [Trifolium medium]
QAWALMASEEQRSDEGVFVPYVPKKAKEQNQRLAKSGGKYNTRSKGPPPPYSQ